MDQGEAEASNEYRPARLVLRKQSQQTAQQIKLEKCLLDERPADVRREHRQYLPIQNSFSDCRPATIPIADNSPYEQEYHHCRHRYPHRDLQGLPELI